MTISIRFLARACKTSLFLALSGILIFGAAERGYAEQVKDPLEAFRPKDGDTGGGKGLDFDVPEQPQMEVKVSKQDMPRTDEPLEDYTEYYDRKVVTLDHGMHQNRTLTYFWLEPHSGLPRDKQYPLIIVLHDEKGVAHAGEFLVRSKYRKEYPAFVAVPVLPPNKIWAFPTRLPEEPKLDRQLKKTQAIDDVAKMVNGLLKEYPIDRRRIYVIGCAEGGFGAFGAVLKHPGLFAASVPISGGWSTKDTPKMTKVPLFVLHGEKDTAYPSSLSQNTAFMIQQLGGKVYFVKVPGMEQDCGNARLYQEAVWNWMFKQRK